MNVIFFPVSWKHDGGIWHGGRFFKSVDELSDALSDKDWRRLREWELRRLAWRMHKASERGVAQGGGSAA
jgi:hypothetical protein